MSGVVNRLCSTWERSQGFYSVKQEQGGAEVIGMIVEFRMVGVGNWNNSITMATRWCSATVRLRDGITLNSSLC